MSDAPETRAAESCYRHPDRQSWILCQRCGRTICPECQTQAAVGVHCPECTREARASMPRQTPRIVRALRSPGSAPVVSYGLMAVTAAVFVLQLVTGMRQGGLTQALLYYPPATPFEPWTMITSVFVHASLLHIGFNMLSLYLFGPILEQMIGRSRFLALYLISGFGGSVAVLLLSPMTPVYGASGAIFGLLGAFFVIQRRLGGNATQILIVVGLNLAIGFFVPNISWQAHVGGLVAGAAVAFVFLQTRQRRQRGVQIALVAGIVLVLVATTVARFALA